MNKEELYRIQLGHLVKLLPVLLDFEEKGYTPSLAEIVQASGISEKTFFMGLKNRLIRAGLVIEETLTSRTKTLKLTDLGRKLAVYLRTCKRELEILS